MKFLISAIILVTQSFKLGHQETHGKDGKENLKTGMKINSDVGDNFILSSIDSVMN